MTKVEVSILEALKFARHDFLNELQLVLMHLDLDNVSQAKQSILTITDTMNQHAQLAKMRLPALENWLTTFQWVHTSFQKNLTCKIQSPIEYDDEGRLVNYLDELFLEVEKVLNLLSEYEVHFKLTSIENDWSLCIQIQGELPKKTIFTEPIDTIIVDQTISHNLWTFTIRGR